jgi:hypothetical protein
LRNLKRGFFLSRVKQEKSLKKKQETFSKNEGFLKLQDICKILNGEADIDVDSDIIVKLKYAPITSADVERSFSAYKKS